MPKVLYELSLLKGRQRVDQNLYWGKELEVVVYKVRSYGRMIKKMT